MNARGILLQTPGAWSEPMHWPLREGERKLLTVGSNADWSIADGALLPIHATLYFDGTSLCVAAAPGALLNGEPLGRDWSPLALPAQLSLGETKITLAPSEQERPSEQGRSSPASELDALNQKTTIMGFPDLEEFRQASRIAGARKRLEQRPAEPEEADRVTPTGMFQSPFFDPDATQFAVPVLGRAAAPHSPTPSLAPPAAAISSRPPARSALMRSLHSASWPKRLSLLLLPVVLALYTIKALRVREGAKHARTAPSSNAARSAPSSSAAAPTPTVTIATRTPSAPSADPRSAGITLQRRAVDAFATGNFRDAALLYQRLAAENPSEAAFAVAARLASERANGAGHD
jgi:hypothetical protein